MENRLLITGRGTVISDMDVTEEQFYPPQNYPSGTKFISIYEIENGLELNGQYFFPGDGRRISSKELLKGNNLITTGRGGHFGQVLANYDFENIMTIANIPAQNNDEALTGRYNGIISYYNPNNLNSTYCYFDYRRRYSCIYHLQLRTKMNCISLLMNRLMEL